jgi:hypothetical protein
VYVKDEDFSDCNAWIYPELRLIKALAPGQACIPVTIEQMTPDWLRVSQRCERTGRVKVQTIIAAEFAAILARLSVEWELLERLGVRRVGPGFEHWPAQRGRAASLRALLVVPDHMATPQGLTLLEVIR